MAWEFLTHSFSWSPGKAGKGYLLHDGTIHTWPIDMDENPHHIQEYDAMANPSPLRFLFDIDPAGGVHDGGKGFTNSTGKPEDTVVQHLISEDPRLHDARHEFDNDLLDQAPDMDAPIGRDDSFGHAYKLMDILGSNSFAYEAESSGHRFASMYDELTDWLNGFGGPSAPPTLHHPSVEDIIPSRAVSPSEAPRLYPPGHEPKEAAELHVGLSIPDEIATKIRDWVDEQDWPKGTELEDKSEYHITLLYAPDGHEDHADGKWINHTDGYDVEIVSLDEFPSGDEKAIVLRVRSPEVKLHAEDLQDLADNRDIEISRFPGGYKPHITVAYGPEKPSYAHVPKLKFKSGPSSVSKPRESARSPHQLEWTKGQEGKGMLYPDGSVQTWNINDHGEPHHRDMYAERQGFGTEIDHPFYDPESEMVKDHIPFIIDPKGTISHSWTEDGEIPQSKLNQIAMADYRLSPGTVKGDQYGHGFALMAGYEDQMAAIAHAYDQAPAYDPQAHAAWQELAEDSKRRADEIRKRLNVSVTDESEPYPNAHAMIADINRGNFVVSRANSEHPIWTPEQNVDFRTVHDVLGHHVSGGDFSWEGENQACDAHSPLLSPDAQKALFTECIAQTAYANQFKGFGPQKTVFLPQFEPSPDAGQLAVPRQSGLGMPEGSNTFCHRHIRHGLYKLDDHLAAVKMPDPPKEIWDDLAGGQCQSCGAPMQNGVCPNCARSSALASSYEWVAKNASTLL